MTALRRYYARAPITEALIAIQVPPNDEIELAELAALNDRHEPPFPNRRDTFRGEFQLDLSGENEPQTTRSQIGYTFGSEDETSIAQLRRDGVYVSNLSPYRGWESLRAEAIDWWRLYSDVIQVDVASRLAVRYINKILIPGQTVDFADYLRTYPEISHDMNQEVSGYFFQFTSPQPDVGGTLILNQGILPERDDEGIPVVLDIDLFVEGELPADSEALWGVIDQLHDHKNRIFEACITERTRELIG